MKKSRFATNDFLESKYARPALIVLLLLLMLFLIYVVTLTVRLSGDDAAASKTAAKESSAELHKPATQELDREQEEPVAEKDTQENDNQQGTLEVSDEAADSSNPALVSDPWGIGVLVNKRNALPQDFEPRNLVSVSAYGVPQTQAVSMTDEAARALGDMYRAAANAGAPFNAASGYRSLSYQTNLYASYVAQSGQAEADTYSARPRHSEHHTGLAVDVSDPSGSCVLLQCYESLPSGLWLAQHSWEYGYILRYPKGLDGVTGYMYEPWHFRYIGRDAAAKYHSSGAQTYEDFMGAGASPDYN